MSVTLSDQQNKLIKTVAGNEGLKDFKIEAQSGSMKGDGYLGIINTIHVQDKQKELNLIMKSALSGEQLRQQTPVRKAYEREIYMYTNVFPEFKKFSQEKNIKNAFTETAQCYGSSLTENEECIILQNLKEIGFRLWNRKKAMNEDHVALVFATYAKFHGTGLAFKILNPEKFEEMSKNLVNIFLTENKEEDKKKFEESGKQIFGNGFRAVAGNEKATQALTRFAQESGKFFGEDTKRVDKYSTILHGDCWCNNMMYRYLDPKNPDKPTEVCLLDWQLGNIGNPILDLSYFFYACSSKEVIYNLKKFLKIYHDSLSKTLREAGLDPEEVFSYKELEAQWKIFSKFGLFMALFVMRVILGDADETPDLAALAEEGKDILQSITGSESSNSEEINKRIYDIVVFMEEHDYL